MILLLLWWAFAAQAEDIEVPSEDTAEEIQALKWSGVVLAYPSGSSVDGAGLGIGGQLFARPPGQESGYTYSITASFYANFRFDYTHNIVRFESKGNINWLAMVGFSGWKNLVYAGQGGQSAMLFRPELEAGNSVSTPFAFLAGTVAFGDSGWSLFGQTSVRYANATAAEGGLLDQDQALGLGESGYADATFGAGLNTIDQWPLPDKGWQGEASIRAGFTAARGEIYPMGSAQMQVIRWQPLWKKHLVLGVRLLGEKAIGQRPFYEQDRAGLRWRDVYGEDQLLIGYGKNRARGDGLVATAIELRLKYAHHHHKFWDFQGYISIFAEEAWLWDRTQPGPHLPTISVAPVVLFQHAIVLRPYIAWGWRSDAPDDPRRPMAQFGLSLMDPL